MSVKNLIKKMLVAVVLATALLSTNVAFADESFDDWEKNYWEQVEIIADLEEELYAAENSGKSNAELVNIRTKISDAKGIRDGFKALMDATGAEVEAGETILPSTSRSVSDCKMVMNYVAGHRKEVKNDLFVKRPDLGLPVTFVNGTESALFIQDVLGCGIKTGNIKLWMAPYYVRFLLEFALNIAGVVAMLGIVIGGYLLLFSGITEDKDKGKKAILYAVAGYIMTLVAWAVVNIVISFLTI